MFRYFWSALSFIVLFFILIQLFSLFNKLPKSTKQGSPLAAKLFQQLQEQDLLVITDDWRITLPSKDHILVLKNDNDQSNRQQGLIDDLYEKQYGKRLRKQVNLWNYSRRLAAIRDNRHQENDHNNWQISDENKVPVNSFSLVPLSFGYLTQGKLLTGFHNWLGAGWQQRKLIFSSKFDLKKKKIITLHIIGTPDIRHLGAYKPRLKICTPESCQRDKARTNEASLVSILKLTLPAKPIYLEIPISTSLNPAIKINGLAIMVTDEHRAKKIQTAKQTDCQAVAKKSTADELANAKQVLLWNNCSLALSGGINSGGGSQHQAFQIISRDKVALTKDYDAKNLENMGKPSEFTANAGLMALIGQDKKDIYSLSGLMWNAGLPKDAKLQLTLDSRLQSIAQKNLEETILKRPHPNRRAAVVILNPKTGEILAAANYPNPKKGVHLWDRKVISELYPNKDPYSFNPWQGLTGDNAPGSTFKMVTALAAMQDSKNNPLLETMLKGIPPKQYKRTLGLDPRSHSYRVKGMNKAVHSHSINEANIPLSNGICGDSKNIRGKVGVAEATSKSLNNWFIHLGILMDQQRLNDKKQLQLVKTADWLGFNQVYSLGDELRRYKGNDWKRGDVLNAFGGRMGVASKDGRALFELANNSYGQGVATTPLQMARVAATLATRKNRQPILIQSLAGKKLKPPKAQNLTVDSDLLDELKLGMRGVVQKGTAKGKFKGKLQCQVYGKTGTAEVSNGKSTMWLMGWYEPKPNQPELSFACMATHYPNGVYGGTLCAPIINKILQQWKANRYNTHPNK